MLQLRSENKSMAAPEVWPWELTDAERETLAVAQLDLKLKREARDAALKRAAKRPSAEHRPTVEVAEASAAVQLAVHRLSGVKADLRAAVQRRLTPPELRD